MMTTHDTGRDNSRLQHSDGGGPADANPWQSEGFDWALAILAAIGLAASLFWLGRLTVDHFEYSSWTDTTGTVVVNGPGARHPSMLAVDYLEFHTDERLTNAGCKNLAFGFIYEGSCRVNTDFPTYMGSARADLSPGDEVIVFYDPDDPAESALERPETEFGNYAVASVLVALLASLLWYETLRLGGKGRRSRVDPGAET